MKRGSRKQESQNPKQNQNLWKSNWKTKSLYIGGITVGILLIWAMAEYASLPGIEDLKEIFPSSTAFMRRRQVELQKQGKPSQMEYYPISIERISPHLVNAVLVAEDSRFYMHEGFDFTEIKNAFQKNMEAGRIVRGASTITQQLAKNLYLSPSKNPMRKFKEVILTRRMEKTLSKERILEIYLNVIEWGETIYGAEAAAKYYFGIPASGLSPKQSVLLASIIPNPRKYNPYNGIESTRNKMEHYLRLMRGNELITEDEYRKSLKEKINLKKR